MKQIKVANGEIHNAYSFDELSSETQQKVLSQFTDTSLDYEWWESVYMDAKNVGIKITGFDIDRGNIDGDFINDAQEVIAAIKENHGKDCETYKTAVSHEAKLAELRKESDIAYSEEFGDDPDDQLPTKDEYFEDNYLEDWAADFKQEILEDYLILLRQEAEYLSSEDAAKETIEANDYLFNEDGEILPVTYHTKNNVAVKHTWKNKHECEIIEMQATK